MYFLKQLALAAALVAPCLSANVAFTGPDTNKNLNLSAPVTISWVVPSDSLEANNYDELDLRWMGGGVGHGLVRNWPVVVGQNNYVWDPKNITTPLASEKVSLLAGREYYFEAEFHKANSSSGPRVRSDRYAVEGYPFIGAGNLHRPGWGLVSAAFLLTVGGLVV